MTSPAAGPRLVPRARAPRASLSTLRVDAPRVAPEEFLRLATRDFRECEPVGHLWSPADGMQCAGWGAARRFEIESGAPFEDVAGANGGNGSTAAVSDSCFGPGAHAAHAAIDRLAEGASGLWGELADVDPLALRLYGGLAFDPGAAEGRPGATGSDWGDFGAGSFVLPQVGYVAEAESAYLYTVLDGAGVAATPSWRQRLLRLADELDPGNGPPDGANGNGAARDRAEAAPDLPALPEVLRSFDQPATEEWLRRVEELRSEVSDGRLQKVVAARTVELGLGRPFGIADLARITERLRRHMPTCTCFAFLRGGSIFFGATPELLVRRRGRRIETQALAGSIASDPFPEKRRKLERRLLESAKDRLEHDLVVRYLVERLDRSCGAAVPPSLPRVRVLRNVLHLETPICAALAETAQPPHVLRLVRALHPTPAVAGSPTAGALQAIRRSEDRDRGWYAGPVGWFDGRGDGEFSVALRSCLAAGRKGLLYSGAGIVADSDPDRELAETNLKLDAILGAWS